MTHFVTIQQTLITLLQRSTEVRDNEILPNHLAILSTSNTTRASVIQAMASQFQRLSQAAPLLKALSSSGPVCRGKLGKHWWTATGVRQIEYPCRLCRASWIPLEHYHKHRRLYSIGNLHISLFMLVKEHLEDAGDINCRVCSIVSGNRTFEYEINGITKHLDIHTSSEIRVVYSSSLSSSGERNQQQ